MRKYYRVNYRIQAEKIRLISPEGKQIGILSITQALEKAKELNLDMVEIVPSADPPVCKLLNFKKFLYEKQKEERKAKKSSKVGELKELRFGPNIGPHDLKIKIERAEKFLRNKYKVKFTIQLRGRESYYPNLAFKKLNEIIKALSEITKVEQAPGRKGQFITTILEPK